MEDGEDSGISSSALQMLVEVDALKQRAESAGRQTSHPLVEVTQDDLRTFNPFVVDKPGEPRRLVPPLKHGGSQVDVIDVQCVSLKIQVRALARAWFARSPRQVVLTMVNDREAAQHDVPEEMVAQVPHGSHDPSHAQGGADFLGLTGAIRPRSNYFLKRH